VAAPSATQRNYHHHRYDYLIFMIQARHYSSFRTLRRGEEEPLVDRAGS
jgi:hypothetical protein